MISVFPTLLFASLLAGSTATFFGSQPVQFVPRPQPVQFVPRPQPVQYVPPVLIYHLVRTNVVPAVSVNSTALEPTEIPEADEAQTTPTPDADESSKNGTADEVDAKKLVPSLVTVAFVPVRVPFGGVGPLVRTVPYVPGYGYGYGYVPCFNCPGFVPGNGALPYGVYYG